MKYRIPTYGAAVRMAQLVSILSQAWRPLSIEQLLETLNISKRTFMRYKEALNETLAAADGSDFLCVIKEGKQELWYLSDQEEVLSVTSFKVVSVTVAKVLLKSFEGTILEDGMEGIRSIISGQLPPSRRKQLEFFDRKIRYTGFGRKNYADHDITLATILRGLIHQKKLRILHYSHEASKEKYHVIRPYTLLLHRDSLYLHAYVEDYKQLRTFSIDRIRDVSNLQIDFKYPEKYDPDKIINGSFGIFEKPGAKPFKIIISFKKILHEYITTRLWHSSQKFTKVKNGNFNMTVYLTNVYEFVPWVLQFGGDVKVLKPTSLQDKIKNELRLAAQNY